MRSPMLPTRRFGSRSAVCYAAALLTPACFVRSGNTPAQRGNLHSRREFLKRGGALMVTFSAASLTGPLKGQGQFDTHPSHINPEHLDSWLAVGADGMV